MRVVIVDDEPLARVALRQALAAHADIAIVGEHGGGAQAIAAIPTLAPDVVFVDVEMPDGDGFALVEQLDATPLVVFVTAHAQHAVRAFDSDALDYLLKPLDQARVDRAVARVRSQLLDHARSRYLERICVRVASRMVVLRADDIDWIAADGNYVVVHAGGAAYSHRASLAALEDRLDPRRFTRIHRGTLVHLDRVVDVRRAIYGDARVSLRDGTTLTLSRRYRATAMAALAQPLVTQG